jgi:ABC-type sugar transport system ATPase subunit
VAGFIGLPPMNFFDVTFEDGALRGKGFEVALSDEEKATLADYNRKAITLGVRPEDIAEGGSLAVKVFSNENLGMNTLVHGHMGDNIRVTAKLRGWTDYKNGDTVCLGFKRKHFFDKETTNAIRKGDR